MRPNTSPTKAKKTHEKQLDSGSVDTLTAYVSSRVDVAKVLEKKDQVDKTEHVTEATVDSLDQILARLKLSNQRLDSAFDYLGTSYIACQKQSLQVALDIGDKQKAVLYLSNMAEKGDSPQTALLNQALASQLNVTSPYDRDYAIANMLLDYKAKPDLTSVELAINLDNPAIINRFGKMKLTRELLNKGIIQGDYGIVKALFTLASNLSDILDSSHIGLAVEHDKNSNILNLIAGKLEAFQVTARFKNRH